MSQGKATFSALPRVTVLFLIGLLSVGRSPAESDSVRAAPSREVLVNLLGDKDPHLRAYALYNMAYWFPEEASRLSRLISDADPWVRRAAIFSLGLLRSEAETERLLQALKDEHYGVRRAAVFALGNIKTPRAMQGVSEALRDTDPCVRQLAALALARTGDKTCVPGLLPLLKDESPRVRRASACALGILGDPSALNPLRQLYRDRKCSEPGERLAAANKEVEKAVDRKVNLDCKFIHFVEMLDKLSEASGVEARVDDEVLLMLNASATDPQNLSSIRLAMWNVPFEKALRKFADATRAYYYVESGFINISSRSYEQYDTPLRMEVAAAMAFLGDRSALSEVRRLVEDRRFGPRARQLLRATTGQ